MKYTRPWWSALLAFGFVILIGLFGLLWFYWAVILGFAPGTGILQILMIIIPCIAIGLGCFWLVRFVLIKNPMGVEIDGSMITIDHIVWKEHLEGIERLEYRLDDVRSRGMTLKVPNLYIYHSNGLQVIPIKYFSDYRGMIDSIQQATGKSVENIDQLDG